MKVLFDNAKDAVITTDIIGRDKIALLKSEEFSRTVLESMNDAIIVVDVNDFSIVSVNSNFLKKYGIKKKDAIGSTCHEITHNIPEPCYNRGELCPLLESVKTDKFSMVEHVHIGKNGEKSYFEVSTSPIKDDNGKVTRVIHVTRDITERKQAEIEMRLHGEIMKNLTEGVYLIRLDDSIIVYTNPKFEEMFGYGPGELIGKDVSIVNAETEKTPEKTKEEIIEVLKKTGEWHGEVKNIKKDGTQFWCYANVSIINHFEYGKVIISVHSDITQRKKSQEELYENEARFRSVAESANDAIITSDEKGDILFWNNGAWKIFGYESKEVIGKPLTFLMPVMFRDAHIKGIERLLTKGESHVIGKTIELAGIRKDGIEFPIELSLSTWKKGDQTFYSGIIRDITERKKAQALILENERLVLANKTKSEFLTVMSHELRTPMNAVIGFSQILKQKKIGNLNEKQEGYLDKILSSGTHLLELINEILNLTQIEAGKMEMFLEKISVPEAVDEMLNLMKTNADQRKITLNQEIDPTLDFIEADRKKLNQILLNLVSNAIKFSKGDGGKVTVKANKVKDCAQFYIIDTGIGIKEEDMSKLFREFQQIDMGISRKYGGTGLGLAITKQLVELHGGRIWAKSKYGEGTTFTFTLPIKSHGVISK